MIILGLKITHDGLVLCYNRKNIRRGMMKKISLLVLGIFLMAGFSFAAKPVPLLDVKKPQAITVDKDQIFITEVVNIFIYSLKDYTLQKKFGREGEGTQEFIQNPTPFRKSISLEAHPDCIIVNSTGKVSYFSRNGNFIKEIKTTSILGRFKRIDDRFVGFGHDQKDGTRYITVNIYSPQFEKGKEIFRRKTVYQEGKKIDPIKMNLLSLILETYVWDNKIFYLGENQEIYVFDKNGEKLYTIQYPYEKVKVSNERKNRYINFFKTDHRVKPFYEQDKERIKFPPYFPLVRDYRVVDNKVYVLLFKEKDGKKEVIIFDIKGRLLKRVFMPIEEQNVLELYPYTIKNGKLYQLVENLDKEEWELHITEIE